MVVAVHNVHDEGDEAIDKHVSALLIVAPELEQIKKLLDEWAFIVICLEELEQLWCDLGSHLCN